jgi:hypothetical protein
MNEASAGLELDALSRATLSLRDIIQEAARQNVVLDISQANVVVRSDGSIHVRRPGLPGATSVAPERAAIELLLTNVKPSIFPVFAGVSTLAELARRVVDAMEQEAPASTPNGLDSVGATLRVPRASVVSHVLTEAVQANPSPRRSGSRWRFVAIVAIFIVAGTVVGFGAAGLLRWAQGPGFLVVAQRSSSPSAPNASNGNLASVVASIPIAHETPTPSPSTPPVPTSTIVAPTPTPLKVKELTIAAWTAKAEAALQISQGQLVSVEAPGVWCMGGAPPLAECGPADGIRPSNANEPDVLYSDAPLGALIGRIGSGPYFMIGSSHTFTATRSGQLKLIFNDRRCCYLDNSEVLSIQVLVWPQAETPSPTQTPLGRTTRYSGECDLAQMTWSLAIQGSDNTLSITLMISTSETNAPGHVWIKQNSAKVFDRDQTTDAEGDLVIVRERPNSPGPDLFQFEIEMASGRLCRIAPVSAD